MKRKAVFVLGAESSGSKLIAMVISNALSIDDYGDWDGTGYSDKGNDKVLHRSLPYMIPPQWPSIEEWVDENIAGYDLYFVICTRDISLSEYSRAIRWDKSSQQIKGESNRARQMISKIITSHHAHMIWSYETFMFLKQPYLQTLYKFLDIESDFMPVLIDGNKRWLDTLSTH